MQSDKLQQAERDAQRLKTLFKPLLTAGLPLPCLEHKFHATRRWRFDYAWPEQRVALEVEGGIWSGGRHIRPKGFIADMEKYNTAAVEGWRIIRCTPDDVKIQITKHLAETLIHALTWGNGNE